ncbi:MAG: aminotransferase class I/II-fold pyridoxal phosphate-dependent enzyme [Candidatus Hydrogenedens sp.]|nr:aminotransferase class I/II-fold pyridoxal phosphate-dependent enzyme [Candidatus Hydrogenedens sp.]
MDKLAIAGGKPLRAASEKWQTWPVSDAADAKLVAEITKSNRWSYDGPVEWQFAQDFAKYQTAKFGLCCANGTVGIQIALEALGIGAYDEVIVPGMTWQATAAACVDVNAVPVLCDVEPDTWNLDLAKVEAAITKKTKAVIVVHLYGSVTDIAGLVKLCKKHNLALIEDCAHQHGTFWKGKGVGSFGDVASFSFQESKVLSCGEGGFNTCNTKELFYKLYSLRNCGRAYEADPPVFGLKKPADFSTALQSGNYRITEWQAAILAGGLKRLDKQVKHRDANAIYLNEQLAQLPGVLPMRRRKEVTQQSYFNFAFRIDPKELKVSNRQFCAALNAELSTGDAFEQPYDPLNGCGLYKPRTKTRHNLGKEYWKAIAPEPRKLPVCVDANQNSGVVVHHVMLMNKKKDMDVVAAAVKKLVDSIDAVRQIPDKGGKKYQALSR